MHMHNKKLKNIIWLTAATLLAASSAYCQPGNELGQTIQINTNLRSAISKASWTLIIRDIDHNQVIPYVYDIDQGNNYWMAFTYGRNYLVTVSELTFYPSDRKIRNFCGLESMGAIQRGTSMQIHLSGKLSRNPDTFDCNVLKYSDSNFNISTPE